MASAYTVEQLLALRPVKADYRPSPRVVSYLSLWRKYIRMLQSDPKRVAPESIVVMRYQLGTPNKVFRRQWIHFHGTTAGLNQLPRYPMRVFSVRVKFLEQHLRACKRTLELLQKQFHALRKDGLLGPAKARDFGPPEPMKLDTGHTVIEIDTPSVNRDVGAGKYSVRDAVLRQQKIDRRQRRQIVLMQTHRDSFGQYSRPLMGPQLTDFMAPPPKGGRTWKKYWYFFRKRGVWHTSEHHPYGDEEPTITRWLSGSIDPPGD